MSTPTPPASVPVVATKPVTAVVAAPVVVAATAPVKPAAATPATPSASFDLSKQLSDARRAYLSTAQSASAQTRAAKLFWNESVAKPTNQAVRGTPISLRNDGLIGSAMLDR